MQRSSLEEACASVEAGDWPEIWQQLSKKTWAFCLGCKLNLSALCPYGNEG